MLVIALADDSLYAMKLHGLVGLSERNMVINGDIPCNVTRAGQRSKVCGSAEKDLE